MNRKDLGELEYLVKNLAEAYAKAGDEVRKTLKRSLDVALQQLYTYTANLELTEHDPDLEPEAGWLPELDVDGCLEEEDGGVSGACRIAGYEAAEEYLESIDFSEEQICLGGEWHRVDAFTDEEIAEIIQKEITESDDDDYAEAREKAGTCENNRKWLKRFCYALIEEAGSGLTLETCDFEPRMTCEFEYDDEGLQKYWIDEDHNKWNARNFSAAEAMKAQDSLFECSFCVDCVKCRECKYCHRCKDCRECKYCEDSVKCKNCNYCNDCQDCRHCEHGRECANALHCLYVEHCEKCKFCVNCDNCRDCIFSQGLEGEEGSSYKLVVRPEEEDKED